MDYRINESMITSNSDNIPHDTGNFECNICFELAQDPIVTLCGHLYCWPCLYQWLQLHSHSHECPICKAMVQEEKLIPIYGRGKANCDPRSRFSPGVIVPNRPIGQRHQTANMNNNEWDPITGFTPIRFGQQTLSTLFGALPAIFNLEVHGFPHATVYGGTSGVTYLFSSSVHGGYVHGFHNYHSDPVEWKPILWKIVFVLLGFVLLLHLLLD